MVAVSPQLTLNLRLAANLTFSNFIEGDNQACMIALKQFVTRHDEQFFYVWGGAGCGRTHVLQAVCHEAAVHNCAVMYVPAQDHADFSPAILDNLEQYDYVVIDDIDAVVDDQAWCEALFHCYNRVRAAGKQLLVSSHVPPRQLNCALADLQSRLSWGLVFQLKMLNDADRLLALLLHAKLRGLELTHEVAHYLLNHYPRDLRVLVQLLDQLDQASLASQRRLTIPFIKEVLD